MSASLPTAINLVPHDPSLQRDWGSPAEVAAREARQAARAVAAAEAAKQPTRLERMCAARETIRLCQVRTKRELLTQLENLTAALSFTHDDSLRDYAAMLADVTSDLENDINQPPAPGLDDVPVYQCEPRGEYDSFTQNVRGRGV